MLGTVEFVWLEDGTGDVVFKGATVELNAGVGAVVLTSPEGLGAAVVPLIGDGGLIVVLELTGADVGSTVGVVELVKAGFEVGNNVPLVETVTLAVGMAELEPLTGTELVEVVLVGVGVARTAEEFVGATTMVTEAAVSVGSGRTKVVEFAGTATVVGGTAGDDEFPVGKGEAVVPLEVVLDRGNGAMVVDGTAGEDELPVGMGEADIVPLEVVLDRGNGPTVVEGTADEEKLPVGMGVEVVPFEVVLDRGNGAMVVEGPAGDEELLVGMGVEVVPLEVVLDRGNGAVAVVDPGTGPSSVVEFNGAVTVVAAAVPFDVMVDTMAVAEGEDADGRDVELVNGKGATRVVELTGTKTLVAAAEPLTVTVDGLAVIVELANGGMVVTTGLEEVSRDDGKTRASSEHAENLAEWPKLTWREEGDCVHGSHRGDCDE